MRIPGYFLCAMLAAPVSALAAAGSEPMGSVGAFASNSSVSFSGGNNGYDEDGTGFGVKGWIGFGVPFASFEYQSVTVGDNPSPGETDEDQFRIGGGAAFPVSEPVLFIGKAEYIKQSFDFGGSDEDVDGFGLHAGAIFLPGPLMHLWGTLGYLMLSGDDAGSGGFGDVDGLELDLGAGFNFTPNFGAFLEYRNFMGSFEAPPAFDDGYELQEVRLGAAFSWGMK